MVNYKLNEKVNAKNNNSGITLISLIITIIVLLILAGVSISMVIGDNSILNQAENAKTKTNAATEKEIIALAVSGAAGENITGNINETEFINELEKNNAIVTKSGSKYKVEFTSGRQYIVDQNGSIKEKNPNPNVIEISELNENASTYWGWDVINYADTLPEELQDVEWQLFYAGAIEGQTEERIYLISKDCIKYAQIPAVIRNGSQISGAKPIVSPDAQYSDYAAIIGRRTFSPSGTAMESGTTPYYTGSNDITNENLQNLNKKYFTWLRENNTESTNISMRSVAYMLDSVTWGDFSNEFAEYSVGGPTLELLFSSYNKYRNVNYSTQVTDIYGYKYDCGRGQTFDNWDGFSIQSHNQKNPFLVTSLKNYWIASCCSNGGVSPGSTMIYIYSENSYAYQGRIWPKDSTDSMIPIGFRPIICLKPEYSLEKTGNNTFRIVED